MSHPQRPEGEGVLIRPHTHLIRRASNRALTAFALALVLVFAVSYTALGAGASLSVTLKPPSPAAGSNYVLTIKGKAKKGHLGKNGKHNRSEIDFVEQFGGTCASTPQAELARSGIRDLGPFFVKKGKFKIKQTRTAATTPGTTVVFCVYLSSNIHKLNATATATYTVP